MNILDKVMVGQSALDGAKKAEKAMSGDNKYDNILHNNTVKLPTTMSSHNTIVKSAEIELDKLYIEKIASQYNKKKKNKTPSPESMFDKADPYYDKKVEAEKARRAKIKEKNMKAKARGEALDAKFEALGNTGLGKKVKGIKNGIKNADKNFFKNLDAVRFDDNPAVRRTAAKNALKFGIPAAGAIGAAGYATTKALEKLERNSNDKRYKGNSIENPGNSIFPTVAGGALAAGLTFNSLTKGSFMSPFKNVGKAVSKEVGKLPGKAISRAGKSGRFTSDIINNVKNQAGKMNKRSFEELDGINKVSADLSKGKALAKKLIVDDFVKEGIKAVPYYAAPAAVSYAVGKDISRGGADIRNDYNNTISVDVPINKINKKNLNSLSKTASVSEFLKSEIPSNAMKGLGRGLFPTAVVGLTGVNITNAMQNAQSKKKEQRPLDPDTARITVSIPSSVSSYGKKRFKKEKTAGELQLELLYNEKLAEEYDADFDDSSVDEEEREDKEKKYTAPKMALGVKKKQKVLD